jgi:Dolichyl-phosphate-mannose-protein mannosyltransferase
VRVLWKRGQLADIAILAVIYIVSIGVVNPLGDFPLNDDWSFARAVKGLIEQGDWRPTGWTSMPLITQALWGAIFCIPAGFSFDALRFSTLTLAIAGILGVYILFITNYAGRLLAVTAALTLAFNPIYHELSFTFMTDVPFTALAILCSIFFVRCIRQFDYLDALIASALALAATLCRQLGLFLPLAFAVALLMQRSFSMKWLARAILPLMVCVTALILFQQWMSITGRTPALYGTSWDKEELSIRAIVYRTDTALLYLGLFCLPILLLGSSNPRLNTNSVILRVLPALSGALFAVVSVYLAFNMLATWMPISKNILIPQGLGPLTFGSYERLPSSFWGIVTALSILGGVLLVREIVALSVILLQKLKNSDMNDEDVIRSFFLTAVGAYALPVLLLGFYDRYLVPLVPFLLYLNADRVPHEGIGATIRKSASAGLITFTAAFAVLGTRDYLTWHRVLWVALTELQKTAGVSPGDIDGGFDYNGWVLDDPSGREIANSIFINRNARYRIAYSNAPGFNVVKNYHYLSWMPPKVRTILLLERDAKS